MSNSALLMIDKIHSNILSDLNSQVSKQACLQKDGQSLLQTEMQEPRSLVCDVRNMANPNSARETSSSRDLKPTVMIVTNIDSDVFSDPELQAAFESTFRELDGQISITYIQKMHRARLQFSSPDLAAEAWSRYNGMMMFGQTIGCFFVQSPAAADNNFLLPPKQHRAHLLSPPSSPPIGWSPLPDLEPVVDRDLLAAIGQLESGKMLTIHQDSNNGPNILLNLPDDITGTQIGK